MAGLPVSGTGRGRPPLLVWSRPVPGALGPGGCARCRYGRGSQLVGSAPRRLDSRHLEDLALVEGVTLQQRVCKRIELGPVLGQQLLGVGQALLGDPADLVVDQLGRSLAIRSVLYGPAIRLSIVRRSDLGAHP